MYLEAQTAEDSEVIYDDVPSEEPLSPDEGQRLQNHVRVGPAHARPSAPHDGLRVVDVVVVVQT